jgi:hypothetical protein
MTNYPGTQPQVITKVAQGMNDDQLALEAAYVLSKSGEPLDKHLHAKPVCIVPHARTIRKAREQVKMMVATGFSIRQIKHYLKKWASWWSKTAETWDIEALLSWFIETCWELPLAAIAEGLRQQIRTTSQHKPILMCHLGGFGVA